ncbi:MAG TPA: S1C family serine protease [Methylomirabilota bacterium]|nr:S1C family serine protease [Methylomirabilota bacterium]
MSRGLSRWVPVALLSLLLPVPAGAAPRDSERRLDPREVSPLPSHVRRVAPAVVGIRVEVPRERPSAATLGVERWGSGVIFDATEGYLLTVSYVLLDAARIEVSLRDGRKVPARLVGLDLEVGVGVARLEGGGPWPAASLGDSTGVAVGETTGTVGVSDEGDLVATPSRVQAVRPFAAAWEYMLDRAFIVTPYNAAFGGAALVNAAGSVIGVTSLRLGEAPHVNLAIPIEKFLAGKDELLARGRVLSRGPRPWLGLYTESVDGGVVVAGLSPLSPARVAGLRAGDIIVQLNGRQVTSREEFYRELWQSPMDQDVRVTVRRAGGTEAITVRPMDRYRFYRTSDK